MSPRDAAGLDARARVALWAAATMRGEGGAAAWAVRLAMRPASALVSAVSARRPADRAASAGAPYVVAVGGLTLGGSGKTPLVARLARDLTAEGVCTAIVSRGYRARTSSRTVRRVLPHDAARDVGDEALLLARELAPATMVIMGRDRARGIALAHAGGADVVLLDDAFQTRGVRRHADIVALDARRPCGTGVVLPAGDLREPARGVSRAEAIVLTRVDRASPEEAAAAIRFVQTHAPAALLATSRHVPAIRQGPSLAGRRCWILSGVADARSVEQSVRALGGDAVGHTAAPDHHVFSAKEYGRIAERASRANAEALVLTDKDAVRTNASADERLAVPRTVIGVDLVWESGGDALLTRLRAGARGLPGRPL